MSARRSRNAGPVPAEYPFVLVHGLLGFGTIGPTRRLEYFRRVMRHLEKNPEVLEGKAKVYVADLDPVDSIPSRAIQLRDFIQSRIYDHQRRKFKYEKVHLIAHSMGGLDARYLISNLAMDIADRSAMAERVASLTTIGTPHLGTPFADTLVDLPVGQALIGLANLYSVNISAFEQLTVRVLVKQGFNERMPDRPGVEYFSYAGEVSRLALFPALLPSYEIIRKSPDGGPNDGLVPVESQIFRYRAIGDDDDQILPADHASQVGHGYALFSGHLGLGFRHLDFYARLANSLGRRQMAPGTPAAS